MCERLTTRPRLERALQLTAVAPLTPTEIAVWSRWHKHVPVIDVIHMRLAQGGHLGVIAPRGAGLSRQLNGGAA